VRIDGVAQYTQGELFYPGTASLVFISDYVNPVTELFGAGRQCGNPPSPLQPPPVFIPRQSLPYEGDRFNLGQMESTELTE
jgi:hypothetical protein